MNKRLIITILIALVIIASVIYAGVRYNQDKKVEWYYENEFPPDFFDK